jgi:hypothetical protein
LSRGQKLSRRAAEERVAYADIYGQGERVVVLAHGGPLQQGELGKAGTGVLSDFLSVQNTLPVDLL